MIASQLEIMQSSLPFVVYTDRHKLMMHPIWLYHSEILYLN